MMYQNNNSSDIKDYLDIAKQGISTFYNIGQMARYRYLYTLEKELQKENLVQVNACELAQNRDKMIKHACLAGLGILGLLAVGIAGLTSYKTRQQCW